MGRFGAGLPLPHPITAFTLTYKTKGGRALDSRAREILHQFAEPRRFRPLPWLKMAFFLLWLIGPTWLRSETISGTIKDPSGAVITGARIEIVGGDLTQAIVLASDGLGNFASPDLKRGTYSVRVIREGFETLAKTVDLQEAVQLELTLAIAQQKVSISVPGKSLAFANSDPLYRQLREIGLGQTFRFDNYTLTWDAATFQFLKGTLTVLSPVDGIVSGAIFIGEGHFNLKAETALDVRELSRRTGAAEANEDFTEVVFRFTREARLKFLPGFGTRTETPAEVAAVFNRWKERMRLHRDHPRVLPSLCCRANPWTTWMLTSWRPTTIHRIRSSLMHTSGARSIKICGFSCELVWGRCLNSIRPRKSR
jgi:hypothetical protein